MTARYIYYAHAIDPVSTSRSKEVRHFLRPDWPNGGVAPLLQKLLELPNVAGGPPNIFGGLFFPPCVGPRDYEDGFLTMWDMSVARITRQEECDFIVLEQDVLPDSYRRFLELFECDLSEVCGFAFESHQEYNGTGPGKGPCFYNACTPGNSCFTMDQDHNLRPTPTGYTWADQSGLGFLRIKGSLAYRARPSWPRDPSDDWRAFDSRFTPWLRSQGVRIHVHWPIQRHLHGKCVGDV